MKIVETPRIELRRFLAEDAEPLAAILADPEVMRFSVSGPLGLEGSRLMIERALRSYAEHGFGRWAVVERGSGELIGFCGVYILTVDGIEEPELGYRLARDRWGAGFGTEAAIASRAVAQERYGLERLIAVIEPDNRASVRVAEKAGFARERTTTYKGLEVAIYAWRASATEASAPGPGRPRGGSRRGGGSI